MRRLWNGVRNAFLAETCAHRNTWRRRGGDGGSGAKLDVGRGLASFRSSLDAIERMGNFLFKMGMVM